MLAKDHVYCPNHRNVKTTKPTPQNPTIYDVFQIFDHRSIDSTFIFVSLSFGRKPFWWPFLYFIAVFIVLDICHHMYIFLMGFFISILLYYSLISLNLEQFQGFLLSAREYLLHFLSSFILYSKSLPFFLFQSYSTYCLLENVLFKWNLF